MALDENFHCVYSIYSFATQNGGHGLVATGLFKEFLVQRPTTKRDVTLTYGEKISGEAYTFRGSYPRTSFVFLNSLDLISCNFSMIFTHFQTKRELFLGGQNPSVGGQNWGIAEGRGGGIQSLLSVLYVKKALVARLDLFRYRYVCVCAETRNICFCKMLECIVRHIMQDCRKKDEHVLITGLYEMKYR